MNKELKELNILEKIAKKYNLETIERRLSELEDISIKLGFLGEFNSGKSTLINALLERKILPAMERPTTKNIITIIPDSSVGTPKFYIEENDSLKEIEPFDFQEIALGRREGQAIVKVPPSEYLPEGYQIIDTPGIASLDKTDIEITLGYLPELDAAIICQDITFGTIPKSVLDFLKRPEIEAIANRLLFVLTKADRIAPSEIEEVKQNVASVLQSLYNSLNIEIDIGKRVFITSAKLALEGKKEYVKEFINGLKSEIISKKEEIRRERIKKELKKISKVTIEALELMKKQLKADTSDIDEEISKLKKEISAIEKEKEKLLKKLDKLEIEINEELLKILQAYKLEIISVSDENELKEVISRLEKIIENDIDNLISRELQTINASVSIKKAVEEIRENISSKLKKIEIMKLILTSILFAVVGPATGAGNAAEAAGGTVVDRLKFLSKLSEKLGILGKFLRIIGKVAKAVNPVEILATPIARKCLENEYSKLIPEVADSTSREIRIKLERILEEVFEEFEDKINTKLEALRELQERKLKSLQDIKDFKESIDNDILRLKDSI